MKARIGIQILAISLMFLAACGGGGGGSSSSTTSSTTSSTGTINVALTDASTTDYQAIYVTVKQVEVHKDGGESWDVISSPNKTYNLLELVNGVREELALATLTSGHYTQMRLILADTPDDSLNIRSVKHPYGNYFIDSSGVSNELKVPSGYQTGIKIVKGFDINANETTELILDFDATRSIVKAGKSGKWLLKPTIKMLATKECSIIAGNAGAEGILVSAQIYSSSATTKEEQVQIQAATVSDATGNYKLFLEPGSYTLVGYKDGYSTYYKNTKVGTTLGSTITENISLVSASTGTLSSGTISIGADPEQYSTISIRQEATVSGNVEQIEVKSLNVANGGEITGIVLPVGSYTAFISTYGKTTQEKTFSITSGLTTDLGDITF